MENAYELVRMEERISVLESDIQHQREVTTRMMRLLDQHLEAITNLTQCVERLERRGT